MNHIRSGGPFRPTQEHTVCLYEVPHYITHCDAVVHVYLQWRSKKRITSVSKCCRRKGRRVIKNKRVWCLREHMCSPNFMATSFFTPKLILCANVTFELEGEARAPAEHWGNGSREDVLIAQREYFTKGSGGKKWNGSKTRIFFHLSWKRLMRWSVVQRRFTVQRHRNNRYS